MKWIGQNLREAREHLGLSREQVFEKTRIPVAVLEALEEGKDTGLPAPYRRAFIRTLAGVYTMDAAALLTEYDERQKEKGEKEGEAHMPDHAASPRRRRVYIILMIASLLIGLGFVYLFYGRALFWESALPKQGTGLEGKQETGKSRSPVVLRIMALNTVWIEVEKDSAEAFDAYLERHDSLLVIADRVLRVHTDDMNAVLPILNGDTLRWRKEETPEGLECTADSVGRVEWRPVWRKTGIAAAKSGAGSKAPLLTGILDEQILYEQAPEFRDNRNAYQPDMDSIHQLEALEPSLNIMVFFRTDDPVSAQVVPQLLKVRALSVVPNVFVTLIGLGHPAGERAALSKMYKIQTSPSIVILSRGHELGRIVGKPDTPIEKKILEIARSADL